MPAATDNSAKSSLVARPFARIRATWPTTKRYIVPLVFIAAAIGIRALLQPVMGQQSFAVFLAAILFGAWYGGVGPAIMSLVILHIVHAYAFANPPGLFQPNLASVVSTSAYYVVGILVGILSQRQRAAKRREREQRLNAISQREHLLTTLSCMADGVLVTDAEGRLTLINPAAEAMTGWSLVEAKGRPWREIFTTQHEAGRERAEHSIERVLQEQCVVHETTPMTLTSRTGRRLPIAFSAAPVMEPNGHVQGAVLVFRDESERQRAELALRNADRRKDEFLATLAHELRNPLAPITMGLELLEISGDDPEAITNVRAMMQRQTRHMVRLIDDLLDVSRITRGRLELRKNKVDLLDIVHDAIESSKPLMDEAQHRLSLKLPDKQLLIYADANRLTQVLSNLLNNAAKFTPRQGQIELEVANTASEVVVIVSDSGIGIPQDKLDLIFDMFAQIHENSAYGQTGLGIGLTLVKRLVEMHGGTVTAESRGRNLGTTFCITLPIVPMPADSPDNASGNGAAVGRNKRRILVVDDNVDALESLSRMIAYLGNDVRQAHDGLEAIEVAASFRPEIVFMDLGMPNLNGFEAARRIRSEPWGRQLSLVATTGWGQEDDRRRTADAGFDRHLVKPIEMASLRDVLFTPVSTER
jgi:PAS domain S-box-containing protein